MKKTVTCLLNILERQYGKKDDEEMVDIIKNGKVMIKKKYGYFYLEGEKEK